VAVKSQAASKPPAPPVAPTPSPALSQPSTPPTTYSDALARNLCSYIISGTHLVCLPETSLSPLSFMRPAVVRVVLSCAPCVSCCCVCADGAGRSYVPQVWYKCLTCTPDGGNQGCCPACAKGGCFGPQKSFHFILIINNCSDVSLVLRAVCHSGHRLVSQGASNFYWYSLRTTRTAHTHTHTQHARATRTHTHAHNTHTPPHMEFAARMLL